MIRKRGNSYRLDILENVDIDFNLPKYKNDKIDKNQYLVSTSGFAGTRLIVANTTGTNSDNENVSPTFVNSTFINTGSTGEWERVLTIKSSFFEKTSALIKRIFSRKPVSVIKTFDLILKTSEELEIVKTRSGGYMELIKKAESMGQVALAEKLKKDLPIKMLENKLFATNFKRFIDEQDVIKFALKCEKGLRLTYVKNYTRIIPEDVASKKIEADALEVFDNYAILHYDPDGKATEMTETEKAKAKDPILFGLIKDSTKLYFIGDWKDELCDLTLEEIVNKLDPNTETTLI